MQEFFEKIFESEQMCAILNKTEQDKGVILCPKI